VTGGLVTVLACRPAETPEQMQARLATESTAARQEIEATITAYHRWLASGDADSMAAMAAADVHVMPPNEPGFTGRDRWRQWIAPLLQAGRWNEEVTTGSLVASGSLAIQTGGYVLTFTPGPNAPAGLTALSDTGKFIWQWRREADRWLLARAIWNSDRPMPMMAPPPPR
jgi:ketosteroid isomerase-like protein